MDNIYVEISRDKDDKVITHSYRPNGTIGRFEYLNAEMYEGKKRIFIRNKTNLKVLASFPSKITVIINY
jgi:hypothetical protein